MAISGADRSGLTKTEWKNATSLAELEPGYSAPKGFGESSASGGGGSRSSGCQTSRTAPNISIDLNWFGSALKRAAVFFGARPPMFLSNK